VTLTDGRASAGTEVSTRTAFRTCPLCEAGCGLAITHDGERITRIRGDQDDVFSHGFICPKGATLKQLHADPDRLRGFARAMTASSIGPAMAIAATFPWDRYQSVIDIGCAEGCVPVQVARAHPHLGGGGFDLPSIQPLFDEYVGAAGLSDRLAFHPGDFFADELPRADVLVMGRILHDWDLDEKRVLLDKAYETLPAGGALIVYESIIDDDRRENAFGLLMSLNMLIETTGGFDYTGADCRGWMADAGFSESYVQHLMGPTSMVVGIK